MPDARLRRAVHFVPGGNERMLTKSLTLEADSLVLDLEDAVTVDRKDEARALVSGWLRDVDFGRQERVVRVNALDTPWWREDLAATMVTPPDAYMLPKIGSRDDVQTFAAEVARLEALHGHTAGSVRFIVLGTETPQSAIRLAEIPTGDRVSALSWGAEDLSAAIGARRNRDEAGVLLDVFRYCRVQTLLCAAAADVQPIDTVYVDIRNLEGLRRDCQEAVWMGFTGRLTIHPDQIPVVNELFTPSPEDAAEAQELLDAVEAGRAAGQGAITLRGQMVDAAHIGRAETVLARARQAGVI
jgi:citrate lyase subunit beta/citryl-CoA lyase